MIVIYKANGERSFQSNSYEDMRVTKEINQLDKISFSCDRELGVTTELEGLIQTDLGYFTIKERHRIGVSNRYEIIAEQSLETLDGVFMGQNFKDSSLRQIAEQIISGKGWSVISHDIDLYSIEIKPQNIVDCLFSLIRELDIELRFDTNNKILSVDKEITRLTKAYFHSSLNMQNVSLDSDSYGFASRIIPVGKDGLTIETVNSGLNYIDIKDYMDENYPRNRWINKIVTKEFVDERFTNPQNLKDQAIQRIREMYKTKRSIQCDVVDIRFDEQYNNLIEDFTFTVGDKVTVIDEELKMKEIRRIQSMDIFPNEPSRNKLFFDDIPRSINDLFKPTQPAQPAPDFSAAIEDLRLELGLRSYDDLFEWLLFGEGLGEPHEFYFVRYKPLAGMNQNVNELVIPEYILGKRNNETRFMFNTTTPIKQQYLKVSTKTAHLTSLAKLGHFGIVSDTLDIGGIDSSNVTDMRFMLMSCKVPNIVGINKLNYSKMTSMDTVFAGVTTNVIDLSNANTYNVQSMASMFANSSAKIDIRLMKTYELKNTENMFGSISPTSIILGIEDMYVNNVERMGGMFSRATFQTLDLSRWNVDNVTSIQTNGAINTSGMFAGSNINTLDISCFNNPSLFEYNRIFYEASINTILVKNESMQAAIVDCLNYSGITPGTTSVIIK